MATLIRECRAKINLYLRVNARREDSFHELETLFQEIDLADLLCWEPEEGALRLTVEGAEVGPLEQNLVMRAIRAFEAASGRKVAGHFRLMKRIPAGGGLGGGSSDAAQTLLLVNQQLGTPLNAAYLEALALELGSDVPFFLRGGCALGRGRGERLVSVPSPGELRSGLLLLMPWSISTGSVFRALKVETQSRPAALLGENDLLKPALAVSPEFAACWRELEPVFRDAPFFMTGSGSTLVSLCGSEPEHDAERAALLEKWRIRVQPFRFVG